MKWIIYVLVSIFIFTQVNALEINTSLNCSFRPDEFYRLEKVNLTNKSFIGGFALGNKDYLLIEIGNIEEKYWYFRTIDSKTYFLEEKPQDFSVDYIMKVDSCNIKKLIKNTSLFPELYSKGQIQIRTKHIDYPFFKVFSKYVILLYDLIK
ncbi:MAG: hypothetical protein PHU51_03215 [Candidatus Nanoarchaeia archaeon]|nr:hypothetical protein [Candidatus Nanoarchaeia archaeon]